MSKYWSFKETGASYKERIIYNILEKKLKLKKIWTRPEKFVCICVIYEC